MYYKIGEVAKLLGITSQAIRFYEEKGIINPIKSSDSNYRRFTSWDIDILVRARLLRSYDYTMLEIADILNNTDISGISSRFREQEDVIKDKIKWNVNILKLIQEETNNIDDIKKIYGKHIMQNRPAMYRLEMSKRNNNPEQRFKKETIDWIQMVPFVSGSVKINMKENKRNEENYHFGQVIDKEYADYFNVKRGKHVHFLPSTHCIHTIIKFDSEMLFAPKLILKSLEYVKSQGLEVKGDIITKIILLHKNDDKYDCYHKVWIPV